MTGSTLKVLETSKELKALKRFLRNRRLLKEPWKESSTEVDGIAHKSGRQREKKRRRNP